MKKELNWAVIANEMAQALQKMDKKLYGVANRTQEKALAFPDRLRRAGDYAFTK